MSIVFDSGENEKSYCNDCGYQLVERKDGSKICSYIYCSREYASDSISKHKSDLRPDKSRYDNDGDGGPIAIPLSDYAGKPKKKPTILDREEKAFIRQGKGRKILDVVEFMPGERTK